MILGGEEMILGGEGFFWGGGRGQRGVRKLFGGSWGVREKFPSSNTVLIFWEKKCSFLPSCFKTKNPKNEEKREEF